MARAFYADVGHMGYGESEALQKELAEMRLSDSIPDVILFTEHTPALLFSRKITSFSHEAISAAQAAGKHPFDHVKDAGIDIHHTDFDAATYVGPGQIAVYPVIDYTRLLKPRDAGGYQALLDGVIMSSLESMGVHCELKKHVTVNIDGVSHRIASKAVKMGQKVAVHGFHIHVATQATKHFGLLNIPDSFASAEDVLGYEPAHTEVKAAVLDAIRKQMKYDNIDECAITRDERGLTVKKV